MLESCLIPSFPNTPPEMSFQMITSFSPNYPVSFKQSISRYCENTLHGFNCNVYMFYNTPFPDNCSFPLIDSIVVSSSSNNDTTYHNMDKEIQNVCARYVSAIAEYSTCISNELFADKKNVTLLQNAMILSYAFDKKENSFYLKSWASNDLLEEIQNKPSMLKIDVESLFYIMLEVSGENDLAKSD